MSHNAHVLAVHSYCTDEARDLSRQEVSSQGYFIL